MRFSPTPTQLILSMAALAAGVVVVTLALGLGAVGTALAATLVLIILTAVATQGSALGRAFRAPTTAPGRSLRKILTQTWWAPLAGLYGLITLVFGILIGARDSGDDLLGTLVGVAVTLAFGTATLAGLVVRLTRPAVGGGLIMIGTVLLAMAYWMVWPPVIAAIIWIGVIASTVANNRRRPRTAWNAPAS